jgi:hypothetical protein
MSLKYFQIATAKVKKSEPMHFIMRNKFFSKYLGANNSLECLSKRERHGRVGGGWRVTVFIVECKDYKINLIL